MTSPLATIIIPTRDRQQLLSETLRSLTAQDEPRWEAIVLDDGSSDETPGLLASQSRADARIRAVPNRPPGTGACAARNRGLTVAAGRTVIFLDDDDLLEPFALRWRLDGLARHDGVDFVVSQARCFREHPDDVGQMWNVESPDEPAIDLDRFLSRDIPWQTTGPTWRREALDVVVPPRAGEGPWDVQAPSAQDLDLHVRALISGCRYRRLGGYDYHWRVGSTARSSIGGESVRTAHWRYRGVILERFARLLRGAGRLTPRRRLLLAGGFWVSADAIRRRAGHRSGVRDATRLWDRARTLGLIDVVRWLEGYAYLLGYGRREIKEPVSRHLNRRWPRELLLPPSATHTVAPIPASYEAQAMTLRALAYQDGPPTLPLRAVWPHETFPRGGAGGAGGFRRRAT